MSEPTPPTGEFVPDAVLDELKAAFDAPVEEPGGDPFDPTTELVDPSLGTVAPPRAAPTPAATPTIVIAATDDVPDALYLDDARLGEVAGRTDGDGARVTIVIGDELDSTGAFDAVAVPSRSMDPRVRARRIAVKRAQGRRRLIWVALAVGVLLVLVATLAVFASSWFAVDRIEVQGAVYTDPVQLEAVIDTIRGEPVLLVDTAAAERELEAIAWVEVAVVRRRFPDTVLIDIRERQPLATFQGSDGQYRVIDRDGRALDVLVGQPIDYLLLTGPAPDTEVGGLAGPPFAAAAQMVSALPAEIRAITLTASVDATTGDLGLVLVVDNPGDNPDATPGATPNDTIEVRLGGYDQLDNKLARLLKLVRDGLDGIVRIDVSTDDVSVTKR